MSSDREKQVEEVANFIINNISLATSINLLIQDAREAAEIIVDNGYEKEDFELYLNQSKETVFSEKKGKKKSKLKALLQWIPFELHREFPFIKVKKMRSGFSTKK